MSTTVVVEKVQVFGDNEFGEDAPVKTPFRPFGYGKRTKSSVVVKAVLLETGPGTVKGYSKEEEKLGKYAQEEKLRKFAEEKSAEEEKEEPKGPQTEFLLDESAATVKKETPKKVVDPLVKETTVIISEEDDVAPAQTKPPMEDKAVAKPDVAEPEPPIVIKKKRFYDPDVPAMKKLFSSLSTDTRKQLNKSRAPIPDIKYTVSEFADDIERIAKENDETLDLVYTRLQERVISGYTYSVDAQMPNWSIKATPVRNVAGSCLKVWETKEVLPDVDDIFNDFMDYSMQKAEDVRRVNRDLSFIGLKLADHLPDRIKVRAILLEYLNNMKKVAEIVGEIDQITKDLPDKGSAEIEEDMQAVKKVFERIQSKMKKIKMSLQCTEYAGFKGIIHDVIDFESLDNVSRRSTLKAHSSVVSAVVHYFWKDTPCLASGSRDHEIKLWDLSDNSLMATLDGHNGIVNSLALYQYNGVPHLASGSFDHTVKLWNLDTKECVGTLEGHQHYVYSVSTYYKFGIPYLASASCDGDIKAWRLDSQEMTGTIREDKSPVFATASFVHNGLSYLASGGQNDLITVWDLFRNLSVNTLSGHTGPIRSLASYQAPDGTKLVSASEDGTIKIWDLQTGHLLNTLIGHHGSDITVATSKKQGKPVLASGDENGLVKFWDLETGVCVKTVQESGPVKSLVIFMDEQRPHIAVGRDSNDGGIDMLCE